MNRTFRGKEIIEWKLVENIYKNKFENELNSLMDKFEFIDCQFSTTSSKEGILFSALVLIAEKEF